VNVPAIPSGSGAAGNGRVGSAVARASSRDHNPFDRGFCSTCVPVYDYFIKKCALLLVNFMAGKFISPPRGGSGVRIALSWEKSNGVEGRGKPESDYYCRGVEHFPSKPGVYVSLESLVRTLPPPLYIG
jgi:hypothetical protein